MIRGNGGRGISLEEIFPLEKLPTEGIFQEGVFLRRGFSEGGNFPEGTFLRGDFSGRRGEFSMGEFS